MKNSLKTLPGWHQTSLTVMLLMGMAVAQANADPATGKHVSNNNGVPLSEAAQLGKKAFFDPRLSASGKISCASCHDPAHAYGPPDKLPAQLAGMDLKIQGLRSVPSLRYVLNRTPHWSKQYLANRIDRILESDSPPTGGFTWDGRFNSLHEQALAPLLAANEMANSSPATLMAKVRKSAYAIDMEHLYGPRIWQNPQQGLNALAMAIEQFELEDSSFHPYSSKFDQSQRGELTLSAAEVRGLKLFNDPAKGNCASCHTATPGADQSPPLFTDYSFSTLGAPRNDKLSANRDVNFYDLGLCGPQRTDQSAKREFCGMFKTPGLRNVAGRGVYLHNGVFTDLTQVVRFYVDRDIHPEKWYPKNPDGSINKYNDLPVALRHNVDTVTAPMNRKPTERPALNENEIRDVVAFLKTLTDQ